jgi:transcriptional regulator with XRE-family HTH domain
MLDAEKGVSHTVSLRDSIDFLRERQMLNQGEVAILLGMQKSHYSEFMRGKRELPVSALRRAYALGVPADALFQTIPKKERKCLN